MMRSALAAILFFAATEAGAADIALTHGSLIRVNTGNPARPSLLAKFVRELNLPELELACPVTSSIQVTVQVGSEVRGTGVVSLPCDKWESKSRGKFLYRDKEGTAGGVDRILYGPGKLKLRIRGGNVVDLAGPVDSLEVRFMVGDQSYCGRFTDIRRNSELQVVAFGPTTACTPLCGNGVIDSDETCDDGNVLDGDCCGATCSLDAAGSACTGNACTASASCDETGQCVVTETLDCNDDDYCTADSCDVALGCQHDITPGATCEGDGNYCTDDTCDANGTCTHPQRSIVCDDGKDCTVDDACVAGACVGTFYAPWFNEIDYDDSSSGTDDRDEFVEIVGPEGLDLSGYSIVSVEGSNSCLTGSAANGDAHFVAEIPSGTTLADDSGSGMGIYVACFKQPGGASTSSDVGAACSDILDAVASDSNLQNGNLLNSNASDCPDGLLLLDPVGNVVDAINWEGLVPNTGGTSYGAKFYDSAVSPPYSIGRDEGGTTLQDVPGVSIAKITNQLARAEDTSEWLETGGCVEQSSTELALATCVTNTATPGLLNTGQSAGVMECTTIEPGCGNGIVDPGEDCENDDHCATGWDCFEGCFCEPQKPCGNGIPDLGEECDEGDLNSDDPNATCRTDCRLAGCGDGIVDDLTGETCEDDAACSGELVCAGCQCAAELGSLLFSVAAGPTDWCPVDTAPGTWVKIKGSPGGNFGIPADTCNATANNWTDVPAVTKGPVLLFGGAPAPDGIAPLTIAEPQVLGAHMHPEACAISNPNCAFNPSACACRLCFRVEADPVHASEGFVDCDGGSNVDVRVSVDSQGADSPGAGQEPDPVVGGGPDSGPGAALMYVRVKAIATADQVTTCPGVNDPEWDGVGSSDLILTTGVGETTIDNPRICAGVAGLNCPTDNPYHIIMQGSPLDCSTWSENNGAEFVLPAAVLDRSFGPAGTGDLAQVTRLTD